MARTRDPTPQTEPRGNCQPPPMGVGQQPYLIWFRKIKKCDISFTSHTRKDFTETKTLGGKSSVKNAFKTSPTLPSSSSLTSDILQSQPCIKPYSLFISPSRSPFLCLATKVFHDVGQFPLNQYQKTLGNRPFYRAFFSSSNINPKELCSRFNTLVFNQNHTGA